MNIDDYHRMMSQVSHQQAMGQAQFLGGGLGAFGSAPPLPLIPTLIVQPEPDKALLLLEEENAIETV